jgi:hypothetical protein
MVEAIDLLERAATSSLTGERSVFFVSPTPDAEASSAAATTGTTA